MAAEFIGCAILVTLQHPPKAQVQGVVADVVAQSLVLRDVTLLWNKHFLTTHTVKASAIADLEVLPESRSSLKENESNRWDQQPRAIQKTASPALTTTSQGAPSLPGKSATKSFVDPAILSFSKPKGEPRASSVAGQTKDHRQVLSPAMTADTAKDSSVTTLPRSETASIARNVHTNLDEPSSRMAGMDSQPQRESSATATLTEPFDGLGLNGRPAVSNVLGDVANGAAEDNMSRAPQGAWPTKKGRRGGKRTVREGPSQYAPVSNNVAASQPTVTAPKKPKSKGWRQTPLVEAPTPASDITQETRSKPRPRRNRREDTNGWATEDATDIQDMGDFDFELNLNKFDKRSVFADLRKDDTTADDDRLVSFNRQAQPGTGGGKHLHYTENVLDQSQLRSTLWKSEAGESEDEMPDDPYSSGRVSRRGQSGRSLQSRKGSTMQPSFTASQVRALPRLESPRPGTRVSTTASPINGSASSFRVTLKAASNNKPCTCVSPLQMLEIEQLCISESGMSEEMLAENAGRGIAEAALTLPPSHTSSPTVLFLVGNHKSGARTVAGARHLRNRNAHVLLCILGGEREEMLLEGLRRQVDIYKKTGGYLIKWDEFQTKVASNAEALPELIVDSLLGMHVAFGELRMDDQAIAFEMIRWGNRSKVPIISVDVPSGLDAASGEPTRIDGVSLVLQSKYIICLGAPKNGLLHAATSGEDGSDDWQLVVADVGISRTAWKRFGSRRRHGFDFGKSWISELKFVHGNEVV